MFALGEYSTVKLVEACEKCEQARKQVADGVSPTQARQLDKIRKVNDASNTFELIAKEWLQMKDWAEITKTRRLDMLESVVFPAIGKLPVREIAPYHILKILEETAKRGAKTVAAEARRTVSSVFELAVATLRADSDPVWHVRNALPANKTQHKQALNPQQIGKSLTCFDNSRGSYQVNYCMWLMWWTLARPAEATETEWAEFDLDNALWTIPAARMKARKEHVIPLPFQAVKMLRTLQGLTGHRQHLFRGRNNPPGPMTSHSLRQLLKSLG